MQLDDIQAILNMRDAWKFLLNTVSEEVTFEYWTYSRQKKTEEELRNILSATDISATDKALEAFTWRARGQFFWDGNKRTSLLLANKILVSAGAGIMTITDKYMEQFNTLLLNYYNIGKAGELKQFLYENAIQGMKL